MAVLCAQGKRSLRIELPMRMRLERRYNNAAAIHRGPLLYSLNLSSTATEMAYCKPLSTVASQEAQREGGGGRGRWGSVHKILGPSNTDTLWFCKCTNAFPPFTKCNKFCVLNACARARVCLFLMQEILLVVNIIGDRWFQAILQ